MNKEFRIKNNRGTTLIEVIIYVALFGLLMSGAITSTYNLFESSGRNSTKAMLEEEGEFLLGKISWALSDAQIINLPTVNTSGTTLSITESDPLINNPVVITFDGTNLTIKRGTGSTQILNTTDVWLNNVTFTHVLSTGNSIDPESVRTQFTLNTRTPNGQILSQDFSEIMYLKK